MNAGHERGEKLMAVTASETTSTTPVAAGEHDKARKHRLERAEAGDDQPPVSALGGAHDERAAQRGEEGDRDRDHRGTVDVLHRGEHLAAAGQPDQPWHRLGAGDRAGDEEERQPDEQDEQQRAPGLLPKSQAGRGGHARVHARLLAEATKTQNAAASALTVTIARLTQSPVGEPIPVPASMRMSAAF